MKNTGIVIWLVLLTSWIGYQDFSMSFNNDNHQGNLEKRKKIYENFNERFKNLETYINETVNPRLESIEKFLDDNWGEK